MSFKIIEDEYNKTAENTHYRLKQHPDENKDKQSKIKLKLILTTKTTEQDSYKIKMPQRNFINGTIILFMYLYNQTYTKKVKE